MSRQKTAFFVRTARGGYHGSFSRHLQPYVDAARAEERDLGFGGFSSRQLIDSKASFDATTAAMNDANVALVRSRRAPFDERHPETTSTPCSGSRKPPEAKPTTTRNGPGQRVREAVEDSHVTYTLGFYLADDESDGEFHPLRVSGEPAWARPALPAGLLCGAGLRSRPRRPRSKSLRPSLLNPLDSTILD